MKKGLFFIVLVIVIVGCLPEEQKQELQQWAFNLEGTYTGEGDLGTLVITNETSKNDIMIKWQRAGLLPGEEEYISQIQDAGIQESLKKEIVFGEGETNLAEGGENLSHDGGQSSDIYAESEDFIVEENDSVKVAIYYVLKLSISNGSDKLSGKVMIKKYTLNKSKGSISAEDTLLDQYEVTFIRDNGPIEAPVCETCEQ